MQLKRVLISSWEDEVETVESKSDLKVYLDSFDVSYLKMDGTVAKLGLEGADPFLKRNNENRV